MSLRAHYVRLFVLLALLLPLYAAVQLWLLSEPATRIEFRTVTEQVPVEVPVERIVLVPAPSAAPSIDEAENQTDEESESGLPLLLAIPGLVFLTEEAAGSSGSGAESEEGIGGGTEAELGAQADDSSGLEPIVVEQPAPLAPAPVVASSLPRPTPPIAAPQPAPSPPPITENPRPSSAPAITEILVPAPIVAILPPNPAPVVPIIPVPAPVLPAGSSSVVAAAAAPSNVETQKPARPADVDDETEHQSDRPGEKRDGQISPKPESTKTRATTQPESIQATTSSGNGQAPATAATRPPASTPSPSPNREKHPSTTPADNGKQATVPAGPTGSGQQPKSAAPGSKGKGR